jgi:histidinol phosphatase-like PHP family hydrolase
MDLHLHTPASSDFQQMEVTFLDILHRAEMRGLSIVSFTDHNTVAGYRRMRESRTPRTPEAACLKQARRQNTDACWQILVLPAFEFTATFGFHIMGIFSPEKPP